MSMETKLHLCREFYAMLSPVQKEERIAKFLLAAIQAGEYFRREWDRERQAAIQLRMKYEG